MVRAAADDQVFDEARAIRDGGGFGSIIGRNSFQRRKEDALKFLDTIMGIYEGSIQGQPLPVCSTAFLASPCKWGTLFSSGGGYAYTNESPMRRPSTIGMA